MDYGIVIGKPLLIFKGIFDKINFDLNQNKKDLTQPYYYNCLNKNGDIISQCGLTPKGPKPYKIDTVHWNYDKFISTFPFINRKKTVIFFPPTQIGVYDIYKNQLEKFSYTLRSKNLVVVNDVISNVYNDSASFDAEYHITCESRTKRTDSLILFLKKRFLSDEVIEQNF